MFVLNFVLCCGVDRETVLRMLTGLGVEEAEQWLWPELETWDAELQDQSDMWKSHRDRTDCWLELWTSKFKVTETYFV